MAAMPKTDPSQSAPPPTRPIDVFNIPDELADRPNWMYWQWEKKQDGKWTKPPYSPITNKKADVTDPRNHGTLQMALAAQRYRNAAGIGFSLLSEANLTFIDLDHCRDKQTGAIDQWATDVVRRFPESYVEISPSETGLHIIVKGSLPTPRGRKRSLSIEGAHPEAAIEMYCGGRYATITGNVIDDGHCTPGDAQEIITELYNEIAPKPVERPAPQFTPAPNQSIDLRERLDAARRAVNGADFITLYDRGDTSAYSNDRSSADLGLCNKLKFYLNNDPALIDQAFRGSALMREKWNRVHRHDGATYGQMTIERALEQPGEVYTPPSHNVINMPITNKKADPEKLLIGTTGVPINRIKDRFMTAAELCAMVPEDPEWVAKPYVVVGGITELTGQIKSGKSTLLGYLVKRLVEGGDFLGEQTISGPVVYLTEQNATTFREILVRSHLTEADDLHILTWQDARLETWPDIVEEAVAKAQREGARVLIVDTLPQFAGLRGDAENNSGDALAAILPVQAAAQSDLAVIVVRHDRKMGGEVGASSRGSSAFGGAVDIIVQLTKAEGNAKPTLRKLSTLSRFDDTPPEVMIDRLDDGTFMAHGPNTAYEKDRIRTAVLNNAPRVEAGALTVDSFQERIPGTKRPTVNDAIKSLYTSGILKRTGTGKRGDAFRYWLFNEPEVAHEVFSTADATLPTVPKRTDVLIDRPDQSHRSIDETAPNGTPRQPQELLIAELFPPLRGGSSDQSIPMPRNSPIVGTPKDSSARSIDVERLLDED